MTSPISKASLALISLPVSMRSRARDSPISAGSLIVPPSIRGTPVLEHSYMVISQVLILLAATQEGVADVSQRGISIGNVHILIFETGMNGDSPWKC